MSKVQDIKKLIRTIPNFPHEGIMFRDVTTLLKDADGLQNTVELFVERYEKMDFDVVVGIESRGFILGSILAYHFHKGFIPVRKKGKLPGEVISQSYDLEYGTDTLELHVDAIKKGQKVLVIDDLLATGGTAFGAIKLIEKLEGKVVEFAVIVDLPDLQGKKKLEDAGHKVFTLVEYEGL
ncbi:adenine phosphoribosyltransferase [Bacteriovorax sp. Seq25_V]|uniref:adenine phosphoribosyltransferase n=1 Tax=Bacteriovorax sp. Seq25_V TaxID=1201288 RepID=UPI00038A2432|nr:adenine phosphoribosyltransferase [Bacteriovorax sp. Seq25_V]EQC43707.1 adenine phosphoribosyltransferase [Bacteriovorax sp. Seq25_V]